MNPEKIKMPIRLSVYLLGICCICLGIVLCKKCNMGISPISSIPFVLESVVPINFGVLTMFYHFLNTIIQIIISGKITVKLFLQFVLGAVFGQIINLFQLILNFETDNIAVGIILLIGSVFFTALGMVLMINMNLIQNPPDGLVHLIAEKTDKKLGNVKIIYDICCVVISLTISFICLGKFSGFGAATIVSAFCVGRLVTFLSPHFTPILKKLESKNNV